MSPGGCLLESIWDQEEAWCCKGGGFFLIPIPIPIHSYPSLSLFPFRIPILAVCENEDIYYYNVRE